MNRVRLLLISPLSILSPHTYLPYQSDQAPSNCTLVSDHLMVRSLGKSDVVGIGWGDRGDRGVTTRVQPSLQAPSPHPHDQSTLALGPDPKFSPRPARFASDMFRLD
ncbi:hypothetical protein BDW42DRAFT_161816 [Aspergillus taichungensis]|uniref:Uncharacterized protein n=1 Tax=Aspergillus taichungensis TaxID=482145 RepID=A0A2J5I4N9_9EURO|nr:hypothetical protein BDW42DRAFT_161816 [Aspergillus taichungensis]